MIKDIKPVEGALLSVLVFDPCSYEEALRHYNECKEWVLKNGLCFGPQQGIIHSPELPGVSSGFETGIISQDVADHDGWVQKMTLGYFPEQRIQIEALKIPKKSHWEGDLRKTTV